MRTLLPALRLGRSNTEVAFALALAWLLVGCVKRYEFPGPDQPHALVKIRRVYHMVSGTTLDEVVTVNGYQVTQRQVASALASPAHQVQRVHPEPGQWQVAAAFHHSEMRSFQERYTENIPRQEMEHRMESESYSCGSSYGSSAPRTCTRMVSRSRLVTKYRQETKYRWVIKPVRVEDGACAAAFSYTPRPNEIYLLQFTFVAAGNCSLTCKRQTRDPAGREQLLPCW